MTTESKDVSLAPGGWLPRLAEAAAVVWARIGAPPELAVVLGSGLGALTDRLRDATVIPFADIPHFPRSSVSGHAGRLVCGTLDTGLRVLVLAGRAHGYEGYSPGEVALPVRVLARLGVRGLLLTNASGCINPGWEAGDLMRITDHINLSGRNPLVGPDEPGIGPRFPDMTRAYDARLAGAMDEASADLGIRLRQGVYAHVLGPSYETPAEIRMLRTLGADAVGMSTVPEVIAAVHAGIPVAGLACLTNMAAGILERPLSHDEVTTAAAAMADRVVALLERFLPLAASALEIPH